MRRPIYVLFYDSWYWNFIGFIGAIIFLLLARAVLYFPVIKPNIEQQNAIVSRIEQKDVDFSYGDISEFSTHSNAYSQAQEYDGKIVSFTGYVSTVRGSLDGEYGDCVVSIDSAISGEWCADCGINDITDTEFEQQFTEGDKVIVIGEVYHSAWVIGLRNCKIESYDN